MRLTTWNVAMNLRRKMPAFLSLHADIAVLQEVGRTDVDSLPDSYWVGNNLRKGLGAVGSNGFRMRVHTSWDPRIEFVVPLEVSGAIEFMLIAVWVMHDRAIQRITERPNRWQMLQALELYEPLIRSRPTVIAGDFNNAVLWDGPRKVWNHSVAVKKLQELGLTSAYHAMRKVEQGDEAEPTLYWMWHNKPNYHIDYVWLPETWLPAVRSVVLGDYSTWVVGKLSDHVPVVVEIDEAQVSADGVRPLT